MFKRTLWLIVLFCLRVGYSRISPGYIHAKGNPVQNEFEKGVDRLRRNIMLVDSDFEVTRPPLSGNDVKEYDTFDQARLGNSLEGSGDETSEKWGKDTTESFVSSTHIQSTHNVTYKTTVTPHVTKVKENIKEKPSSKKAYTSDIIEDILVSSGDGMQQPKENSTTELTTEVGLKKDENTFQQLPDNCLNTTCDEFGHSIQLSEVSLVPEGTNLTLICRSNITHHHILYWYKSNSSAYILQTFGTGQSLQLNIPDARTYHSGMFKCVEWVEKELCCNAELNLTIYGVPFYKYHFIILAIIVAVGLLVCLFLEVRQSKTFKKYSKEFAKKHGDTKEQLLWN